MRKLILEMTVSADGYVCGPNHENDWFFRTRDQLVKDWLEKSISEAGVHIMGSKTFAVMATYWPFATDQLAEPMNKPPKIVFSKGGYVNNVSFEGKTENLSPNASTWSDAVVTTDLVADINRLKEQDGGPILAHGGAGFAQELVKHDLVDEFRFSIHPVAIVKGISIFAAAPGIIDLQLVSSTAFPSGAIVNVYTVKK